MCVAVTRRLWQKHMLDTMHIKVCQVCTICTRRCRSRVVNQTMDERPKLAKALQLRISDQELDELDAYCATVRRRTGENVSRTAVIRLAIQELLERGGMR